MCVLCWNDKNNEKKWFKFLSEEAALEYVKVYKINDYFIAYEDYKLDRLKHENESLLSLLKSIESLINNHVRV